MKHLISLMIILVSFVCFSVSAQQSTAQAPLSQKEQSPTKFQNQPLPIKTLREKILNTPIQLKSKQERLGIRVVGNGGDFHSIQFKLIASELLNRLKSKFPSYLPQFDLAKFEEALSADVVFLDDEIEVSGFPRPAANVPSERIILVNRTQWLQDRDPRNKLSIVAHEFLSIAEIETTNDYHISKFFLKDRTLAGLVLAVVEYELADEGQAIDESAARFECYEDIINQSFHRLADLVLPPNRSQSSAEYNSAFKTLLTSKIGRFINQHFLEKVRPVSAAVTLYDYKAVQSMDAFFGIIRQEQWEIDVEPTTRSTMFRWLVDLCEKNYLSVPSLGFATNKYQAQRKCEKALLEFVSSEPSAPPNCKGILKE